MYDFTALGKFRHRVYYVNRGELIFKSYKMVFVFDNGMLARQPYQYILWGFLFLSLFLTLFPSVPMCHNGMLLLMNLMACQRGNAISFSIATSKHIHIYICIIHGNNNIRSLSTSRLLWGLQCSATNLVPYRSDHFGVNVYNCSATLLSVCVCVCVIVSVCLSTVCTECVLACIMFPIDELSCT